MPVEVADGMPHAMAAGGMIVEAMQNGTRDRISGKHHRACAFRIFPFPLTPGKSWQTLLDQPLGGAIGPSLFSVTFPPVSTNILLENRRKRLFTAGEVMADLLAFVGNTRVKTCGMKIAKASGASIRLCPAWRKLKQQAL